MTIKNKITFNDGKVLEIEGVNVFDLYVKFKKETSGIKGWKLDKPILKTTIKALQNNYIISENMPNFNQVDWIKENIIFDEYTDVDALLVKMFLSEIVFSSFDPQDTSLSVGDISFNKTKIGNIIQAIPLNSHELKAEQWLWEKEAPAVQFSSYLQTKYSIDSDILIRMNKGGQRMKAGKVYKLEDEKDQLDSDIELSKCITQGALFEEKWK